ncbi:MAG: DUF2997 domain-containing protein [Candidatus Eremiobacteraeota bacterium]|nr:DUF2997 domain-containing protein [Candidatus Eremiobacteraeota bacterium]
MHSQRIHVHIDRQGYVKLEVEGMQGEGCLELTAALEALLGGQLEGREMKPEYYQQAEAFDQDNLWS